MPSKTNYFYFSGKVQDPCPVNFLSSIALTRYASTPQKKMPFFLELASISSVQAHKFSSQQYKEVCKPLLIGPQWTKRNMHSGSFPIK